MAAEAEAAAPRVIVITDLATVSEGELMARIVRVASAPAGLRGRVAVQLRDNALGGAARLALGRRLRAATAAVGARLFINDRIDIAVTVGADGVHLRADSVAARDVRQLLPDAFVTRACHSETDVLAAAEEGCDGALLSPVFASPGKAAAIGVGALTAARRALDAAGRSGFALYALGGVDASNAGACFEAGATGVAMVRGELGLGLAGWLAR